MSVAKEELPRKAITHSGRGVGTKTPHEYAWGSTQQQQIHRTENRQAVSSAVFLKPVLSFSPPKFLFVGRIPAPKDDYIFFSFSYTIPWLSKNEDFPSTSLLLLASDQVFDGPSLCHPRAMLIDLTHNPPPPSGISGMLYQPPGSVARTPQREPTFGGLSQKCSST